MKDESDFLTEVQEHFSRRLKEVSRALKLSKNSLLALLYLVALWSVTLSLAGYIAVMLAACSKWLVFPSIGLAAILVLLGFGFSEVIVTRADRLDKKLRVAEKENEDREWL